MTAIISSSSLSLSINLLYFSARLSRKGCPAIHCGVNTDIDKRMFTIEVKKKRKEEEFNHEDLEMFHGECYGGKLVWTGRGFKNLLSCERCGDSSCGMETEDIMKIVKTAIDGEERKLGENIVVVQVSD